LEEELKTKDCMHHKPRISGSQGVPFIFAGDVKRRQTFIKNFIKKIDLTRTSCKVTYDLARLPVAHEDGEIWYADMDSWLDGSRK
jgi:hypothetical protein